MASSTPWQHFLETLFALRPGDSLTLYIQFDSYRLSRTWYA